MAQALARTLRQVDLTLLLVGTVIGSGIFLVPGAVLRDSGGHVGLALIVWLVGGVLSLLGALTYGELAAASPEAGGIYVYIRDAFGRLPAFLYGWALFFVISSGSLATLAVAFTAYTTQFVALSPIAAKLVSIFVIIVIAIVNIVGTRKSANVQNLTTAIKVGALLVMSALLIAMGGGLSTPGQQPWPDLTSPALLANLGTAMIGVLWAYEGWQYVTFSAGEAINPRRTFPRALAIGTTALIGIYLVANIAYVAALGPATVATSNRVASEAVTALFGPAAGMLIAAAILVSIFSAANGLTLTAPRVYYAMAKDKLFFERLASVHPRFGTPAFAIATSSAWAIYRRRAPNPSRPFSVPGYPLTPALFILAALAIVLNTIVVQPGRALVGIALVLVGVPAYLFWKKWG